MTINRINLAKDRVKLGELLLAHHVITEEQLQQALEQQKTSGQRLGEILISLGIITEQQFVDFFSKQLNIPFYDLKVEHIDPITASALPEHFARLYHAIVIKEEADGSLVVGMADPLNVPAIDHLKELLGKPLLIVLVRNNDLEQIHILIYQHQKEISDYAKKLAQETQKYQTNSKVSEDYDVMEAPVIRLMNLLISDAARLNASDIHIEPNAEGIRIRLRVDGMLQEQVIKEKKIMPAIVSRLKLLSGLNIAEKRLPQDGHFTIEAENQKYDIRISTMPTPFGESVVMRLCKHSSDIVRLEQLGLQGEILRKFHEKITKPNGLILVTGPTSSGKSTTLYVALHEINRPEIKIITVEDPIETFLSWAVQIQANEKISLDFATILRSIVRHDPDVILLGEIRDPETSNIAIRTALIGRLVLSTLHTNDTISSVYRLIDLGVEPYRIAATVQAILAQRLVRLICEHCSENYELNAEEKAWVSQFQQVNSKAIFKRGKGCSYCSQTGYHGRTGIFELLEFTEAMSNALRQNDQATYHQLAQQHLKGKLLVDDGLRLAEQGKTTIQEIMRIINRTSVLTPL